MQTLGFAFVLLGCFLFLLGLFDGFFLPNNWDGPLFWYSWIYSASFYAGIGLVITGSISLITSRNTTTRRETSASANIGKQNLSKRVRLKHFPIDLGIALLAGLVSFGVNTFVARVPSWGSSGVPFAVITTIPGCFGPGGMLGCVATDPLGLALDGAFWTGLTFVILAFTDLITTRFTHGLGKSVGYGSPMSTV